MTTRPTDGPFAVDLGDVLGRPGARIEVERGFVLDDLRTSLAQVPDGSEVTARLAFDSLGDTVVATGSVHAPWRSECRRCLEPVEGELEVEVREVYAVDPSGLDDEDVFPIVEEHVDLEPLVRESVLCELPLAPLCGDDCEGPAPEFFGQTDDEAEPGEKKDPRWAALDELKLD